ncbi:MAG: YaiI/YqxD family protein [bacterium]|nr:YaiI/YqxD family protein [bacterium]
MADSPLAGIKILVDADACPVKDLIERAAARHGVKVWMVTCTAMRERPTPRLRLVRVPDGPDAADDWIVAHCAAGDIVVTQDIPLAAAALARGCGVIENRGDELTAANISARLAMRNLTADLRQQGLLDESGPRPLSRKDREAFARTLGRLLDQRRRAQNAET